MYPFVTEFKKSKLIHCRAYSHFQSSSPLLHRKKYYLFIHYFHDCHLTTIPSSDFSLIFLYICHCNIILNHHSFYHLAYYFLYIYSNQMNANHVTICFDNHAVRITSISTLLFLWYIYGPFTQILYLKVKVKSEK